MEALLIVLVLGAATIVTTLVVNWIMARVGDSFDVNGFGETNIDSWAPPTAAELDELARDACPDCRGSGLRDSGGVHPWGDPILIQCDCPSTSAITIINPLPADGGVQLLSSSPGPDALGAGD